jgi:hypothetical protein
MPRTAAEILEEARQLPPGDQDWLAYNLLTDENAHAADEALEAEVDRRISEFETGTAVTYSWDEVAAPLRARLTE